MTKQTTNKEGKISASMKLAKVAWRTLKLDKELLIVSVIGLVIDICIFVAFIVSLLLIVPSLTSTEPITGQDLTSNIICYLLIAIYLFTALTVENFFSGAISHAALERFRGGDPTVRSSLSAASKKTGPIIALSGLQATVGLVLQILGDRLPFAGKVATVIAGAAWGIATMFSIPIIMDGKETGPIKTVRHSAKTFTNIWGESIFIGLGLGLIEIAFGVIMGLVLIGGIALSIALSTWLYTIIAGTILIIGILVVSTMLSTLNIIIMTAAYHYASTNAIPAGFDDELIRSMFKPKKQWLR